MTRTFQRVLGGCLSVGLMLFAAADAEAIVFDFRTGGSDHSVTGSGFGNIRTFTESGLSVAVSAWANTGSGNSLENGQVGRWSTGLGACNRGEGANCGSPQHQVDNVGEQDFLLFLFAGPVLFDNIKIDPWGEWDRDVTFWVGNVALPPFTADGSGATGVGMDDLAGLGFGAQHDDTNSRGSGVLTIDLSPGGVPLQGNALLFGGLFPSNPSSTKYQDRFKVKSLTVEAVAVPLPAALPLLAGGFGVLGLLGWRRRAALPVTAA